MNMTDIEEKLYLKAMGIEQARKDTIPMPEGVKIPKRMRRTSEGGRCGVCRNDTIEGREDGHGMWHYRCTYCVAHQQPSPDPCPRCRCTAHDKICEKCESGLKNPFKPDAVIFRCLNCSFEWITSEYEKYLLTRVVRDILPTSKFSENRKL